MMITSVALEINTTINLSIFFRHGLSETNFYTYLNGMYDREKLIREPIILFAYGPDDCQSTFEVYLFIRDAVHMF